MERSAQLREVTAQVRVNLDNALEAAASSVYPFMTKATRKVVPASSVPPPLVTRTARMDELQRAHLEGSEDLYFCESTADFTLEETAVLLGTQGVVSLIRAACPSGE